MTDTYQHIRDRIITADVEWGAACAEARAPFEAQAAEAARSLRGPYRAKIASLQEECGLIGHVFGADVWNARPARYCVVCKKPEGLSHV